MNRSERESPVAVAALDDVALIVDLSRDAERDGHRMVSVLISDWKSGTNRFGAPGEHVYVATLGGRVVGVCGLNIDPYASDHGVGRVRRLYVSTDSRRLGVGSVLVAQIIRDARGTFEQLRLRTRNPVAAAFYVSCGFDEVKGEDTCTHRLVLAS